MGPRPKRAALLIGGLLVAVGCRSEFNAMDSSGTESDGTTGEPDPFAVCEACQTEQCKDYLEACQADATCQECLTAPYDLTCLSHEPFQKVANCACNDCATECPHLCPGGQGACTACGLAECNDEGQACLGDMACAPCLDDPWGAGCEQNPAFMAASECQCDACGQECVWGCPGAANACAGCISSMCNAPFMACVTDAACADCFENPLAPGCGDNELLAALLACTCGNCSDLCGVLFSCG